MKRGFTLIELLIVIGLTAFLLTGVFSLYMSLKNLTYTSAQSASMRAEILTAAGALSADIRNAYAPSWNPKTFFEAYKGQELSGRFDTLNFVATTLYANPTLLQTSVFSVTWYVKKTDEGITLYRKNSAFVDYENPEAGIPIPMVHHITSFIVEFSLNGEDWFDEWSYKVRKRLPPYVQITIRWQDSSTGKEEEYKFQTAPQINIRAM
ncbi:MAG: prepilin-type N-terminal cleavage/methylation domain-containing protein [Candidatus Hydrogenedentota bacterium]|nr:MAG: prepilin-type N-terminal cleavage/methylation domain-containing protein [Candidatus Hydrogenedentota bacterium]